jgi:hypothetical protein
MGSVKEWMMDQQEESSDRVVAAALGITYDELILLDWSMDTEESDDGLIYNYIIEINDGPSEILNKIIGLEGGNTVYLSPWELDEPDSEELEWEIQSSEQLANFDSQLESASKVLDAAFDLITQFHVLAMLQVHIVASMEHFLSSTFIYQVTNSDTLMKKLVETDPEFANRTFSLNEIFSERDKLRTTVAAYLKSLIFHDIKKIKPMYKSVLSIDFGDVSWLFRSVLLRHDCAHRAGHDKEGNKISLTKEDIRVLMERCRLLASNIDYQLNG